MAKRGIGIMVSKWDHPPPLCALTGNEKFLIKRELDEAISRAIATSRRIEKISSGESLARIFDESVWGEQKVLVIFEGNDFKDKVLWGHWEKQDNQIAIVLVPGRYKPRILKKLPSSLVAKFESPKPWERDPWVVSFLQKEAEGLGFQISTQLSSLLVKRLGSEDLYLLWQQLWKLKFLLSHEGRSHVQIEDLKATLTKQSSVGAFYLIKKIGYKSKQEVPILLRLIKENGGILFSFLALLMKNLRTWIVVKSLSNKSTSPEEISKRLGISSFLLKKEILTITTRWSLEELSDFMKRVLEVRSAAKKGSLAPWLHLESILLEL